MDENVVELFLYITKKGFYDNMTNEFTFVRRVKYNRNTTTR